jgi:hypothetical protein
MTEKRHPHLAPALVPGGLFPADERVGFILNLPKEIKSPEKTIEIPVSIL